MAFELMEEELRRAQQEPAQKPSSGEYCGVDFGLPPESMMRRRYYLSLPESNEPGQEGVIPFDEHQ
jgi:hypothetical protein